MELSQISTQIKQLTENIVLIYAFNTTGKTRLSTAYKNITKDVTTGDHSGVYYNAFSEDLFQWDNDIENDEANIRLKVKESSLNKFHSLFTEEDVMKKLEQYRPRYNFFFKYRNDDTEQGIEHVSFIIGKGESEEQIKIFKRGRTYFYLVSLFNNV